MTEEQAREIAIPYETVFNTTPFLHLGDVITLLMEHSRPDRLGRTELWDFVQKVKLPMREEIIKELNAKFGLRGHGTHSVLCDIINDAIHHAATTLLDEAEKTI